jgi:hypothetical protein
MEETDSLDPSTVIGANTIIIIIIRDFQDPRTRTISITMYNNSSTLSMTSTTLRTSFLVQNYVSLTDNLTVLLIGCDLYGR